MKRVYKKLLAIVLAIFQITSLLPAVSLADDTLEASTQEIIVNLSFEDLEITSGYEYYVVVGDKVDGENKYVSKSLNHEIIPGGSGRKSAPR